MSPALAWIAAAIALLYVGVAGWLLFRRRRLRREVAASSRWHAVPARVVEARLQEHHSVNVGSSYAPIVIYEYAVGGRVFRSGRAYFGEPVAHSVRRRAERRLATLAAATQAFYDPERPEAAVLERRAPVLRRDAVLLALLALAAAGGVFGAALG